MFIGHWAPALAAAAVSPRAPRLGALFVAAQLVDWAFFALVLANVEHMRAMPGITTMNPLDLYHMPFTHSLLGTMGFAALFAAAMWLWHRDTRFALLAGLVVLSHWPLDWLVHRPDLTLAGSPPKLGLGLWNRPEVAIPLELALVAAAFVFYLWRTRGAVVPALALGVVLAVLQAVNWFGPPPVSASAETSVLAFAAFGFATLTAWWLGMSRRKRRARG